MSSLNSTAVGLITKYVCISIEISTTPTIIIVTFTNFLKLKQLMINEVILLTLKVMDKTNKTNNFMKTLLLEDCYPYTNNRQPTIQTN